MSGHVDEVDTIIGDFSGVVSVSWGETVALERAYGLADRAHGVAATVDTRFGTASGTKGFTALVVASLIRDGGLALSTTARSLLGEDLPLIDDGVTVEHLLAHTSGIGDYVDEEDDTLPEYPLRVPVHTLDTTSGYLTALDGFPQKFPAGTRFSYCNAGFVVLAVLAERSSGRGFYELVQERVLEPAGMTRTAFLRMDYLPGDAAFGYVEDGRTNVLHLAVRGTGDGGAFTTVADLRSFWLALDAGRIVDTDLVAEFMRPRHDVPEEAARYGLGFWLAPTGPGLRLVGGDSGVGFWSSHDPDTGRTCTVITNTDGGVLRVARALDELLP